jgi:hypothetical protein
VPKTTAPRWAPFPTALADPRFGHTAAGLKKHWARLHQGDAEPLPADPAVLAAWRLFHAGDFQAAFDAGLHAGGAGITVAHKAQFVQATHLAPDANSRLAHLQDLAARAEAQAAAEPQNPNAHYWMACALGRRAQGLSVAQALAQGVGARVKAALESTLRLQPRHADAHIALGAFHAEVIDKVGRLLAMTQGADAATGLHHFEQALALHPTSAIGRIEWARAMLRLDGARRRADARRLLAEAAAVTPVDAMERLDVALAQAELAAA